MKVFLSLVLVLAFVKLSAQDLKEKEIRADIVEFKDNLIELEKMMDRSYVLIREWVFIEKVDSAPSKIELLAFIENNPVAEFYGSLIKSAYILPQDQLDKLIDISSSIQTFNYEVKYITHQLNSFVSYDDPFVMFEVTPKVEAGGEVSLAVKEIKQNIEILNTYCSYLIKEKKH